MATDTKPPSGMLLEAVFGSEAIDSSGEILDVEGADISDLENGLAQVNYEHRGDESEGASGTDWVGKVIFAKKVFGTKDCDNDRQKAFWDDLQLPFIYGVVRLYDAAGHSGAKDLAAAIRDQHANKEKILWRWSVEGTTLKTSQDKKRLLQSVIRNIALTRKPCNRSAETRILSDSQAPEGFDKQPVKIEKDFLDDVLKRSEKHFHPERQPLGAATFISGNLELSEADFKKMEGDPLHPHHVLWDHLAQSGWHQNGIADPNKEPHTIQLVNPTYFDESGFQLPGVQIPAHELMWVSTHGPGAGDWTGSPTHYEYVSKLHPDDMATSVSDTQFDAGAELARQKGLKKALEAGNYNAAPGTLTGGAALQVEDPALKRRYMAQRARRALDTWKSDAKPLKQHLQDEMPEASKEFIDRFVDLIDKYKVGRKGSLLRMGNMGSRNITEMEKKERLIRKFEQLDIALRKAAADLQKPVPELPPAMEFGGRSVKPGLAQHSGGDLALLDATPDHLIGVPVDRVAGWHPADLVKLPRVGEGEKFTVKRFPARLDERPVVDAALHGTKLNRHDFQRKLIEGLKLDKPGLREVERRHGKGSVQPGPINDAHSFWYNQGDKHLYVKGFHASEETGGFHQHHREMLFHNLAHEFFGLGEHMPAVAHFLHPQTGESRLAVEKVDGHHVGLTTGMGSGGYVPKNGEDYHHLKELGDDGTLDKLAMMDMITSNGDRHDLNWLMGRDGKIKLIDHGLAFYSEPLEPSYWDLYHNIQAAGSGKGWSSLMDWVKTPLHENAKAWVQGLKPEKLQQLLQEHDAPADVSADTMDRLKHLQTAVASQPNITAFDAFHLPELVADRGAYPTEKSKLNKAWPWKGKDPVPGTETREAQHASVAQDYLIGSGSDYDRGSGPGSEMKTVAEGYKTVPYKNPVKMVGRGSRRANQGINEAREWREQVPGGVGILQPASSNTPVLTEPTFPDTGPQRYRNVTEINGPSDFLSPTEAAVIRSITREPVNTAEWRQYARLNVDRNARENDKIFWEETQDYSQLRPPHLSFTQDPGLEWRFAPSQGRGGHYIASVQRVGDPGWRYGELEPYNYEEWANRPPHAHSAVFYLDPQTKTVDPAHPQNQHAISALNESGYQTPEVLMNHLNDWAAGKLPSMPPVHHPAQSSAGDQFGPGGWSQQQAMLNWLKSPFNSEDQ